MKTQRHKILHISPSGNLYGTERHILSIVKYSDKEQFEHWVVTPNKGYFNEVLDSLGIKYVIAGRIPHLKRKLSGFFKDKSYSRLLKTIKKENFDIIHSHLISYGGFTGKLFSKAKIFHTRHGVFWSEEELKNISGTSKSFQKIKSSMFDITIAIGVYEKNTMVNILGYDAGKVRLTFNGVTVEDIESKLSPGITKNELYGTNDIVIGAVGRLERQKGFHIFVEAASKVIKKMNNIRFVIIGDGSLKGVLLQQIKSLGLEGRFDLVPYKENIFDYINMLDIVVQTSLWEGISYSVLEPMALKKPVIALSSPNTSGVKEIIVEGVTGNLIFDDYVKKLSEAIIKLAGDKQMIERMGLAGYERVKEHFTEKRTAGDMDRYYLESLSGKLERAD